MSSIARPLDNTFRVVTVFTSILAVARDPPERAADAGRCVGPREGGDPLSESHSFILHPPAYRAAQGARREDQVASIPSRSGLPGRTVDVRPAAGGARCDQPDRLPQRLHGRDQLRRIRRTSLPCRQCDRAHTYRRPESGAAGRCRRLLHPARTGLSGRRRDPRSGAAGIRRLAVAFAVSHSTGHHLRK